MLENTLPQLEELIEQTIENNIQLKKQVAELQQEKIKLVEDYELLQLEVAETEENQKQAEAGLNRLLTRLRETQHNAHHDNNEHHEG